MFSNNALKLNIDCMYQIFCFSFLFQNKCRSSKKHPVDNKLGQSYILTEMIDRDDILGVV